jgi:hypothetical protein
MLLKIIFDTNVFIDIQEGILTPAELSIAKRKIDESQSHGYISPLSIFELGSHLECNFSYYRDTFHHAVDLCHYAMAEPEVFMMKHLFCYSSTDYIGLNPTEMYPLCQEVSTAASLSDLKGTRRIRWDGVWTDGELNVEYFKDFREQYENKYIENMNRIIVQFIPDFDAKKNMGRLACMSKGPLRDNVLKFVESDQFRAMFIKVMAERCKVTLLEPSITSEWERAAATKIDAFIHAYKWITRKVLESGYNITKNKNDYNDIHFLIYLADPEVLFVTQDQRILDKIPDSCEQKKRIMLFIDWLKHP